MKMKMTVNKKVEELTVSFQNKTSELSVRDRFRIFPVAAVSAALMNVQIQTEKTGNTDSTFYEPEFSE